MMDVRHAHDDEALEWLFAQARRFPLLEAGEEAAIDGGKWRAIEHMQSLFLGDPAARGYLRALARELLDDPPDAQRIPVRSHARLLRRELGDYLPGKPLRPALERLRDSLDGDDPTADAAALAALQLPAALVAGIAEVLTGGSDPRGVAGALAYWASTWEEEVAGGRCSEANRRDLAGELRAYHRARGRLVNHNLRLVFSIAGRFPGRDVPFRDLVQEGVFGLLRAAEKYRADSGNRFSTYAYNWIMQSMRRALMEQEGVVRFPSQVVEQVGRLYRERMDHLSRTGREPGTALLARRLGSSQRDIEELLQLGNLGVSLDSPQGQDDDAPALEATLAGGPFAAAAQAAEQASLHRCLQRHLIQLRPSERLVVTRRWGLDGSPPQSRSDLARQMDISAERVRQIEVAALENLRGIPALHDAYEAQQAGSE